VAALGLAQAKFEVASIKPADPQGPLRIDFSPGGRFSARGVTVKILLRNAYGLQDYQVSGGPGWVSTAFFDIEARADAGVGEPSREQVLKMIGALLEDRFKLASHRETAQLPIYTLVAGKSGAKLKAAESGAEPTRSFRLGQLTTQKMSMTELANILTLDLKRPVRDETGLKGEFAFTLEWARGLDESDGSKPSLFTAVQEQLGLKLESTKGPVEVLVIDRVERPSEN
jgi:uncharacterized protein (TIGR03435 family)